MTLEDIKIEYRTLRIGFCVQDGNIQDLIEASRLSSILWGGVYNPIIPVGNPDKLDERLVKIFQVDILIPVSGSDEVKSFIDKYHWARLPFWYESTSIFGKEESKKKKPLALDVSHIFSKLWKEEFKGAKDGNSNFVFVEWDLDDSKNNLFSLMFGSYPDQDLVVNYREVFKTALRSKSIKIGKTSKLPALLTERYTPIQTTAFDLTSYGREVGNGVYIGDENDFTDLVNFWNLRASGGYITFVPKSDTSRFLPYARAHIKNIGESSHFRSLPQVSVYTKESKDHSPKVLKIFNALKTEEKFFSLVNVASSFWRDQDFEPVYSCLNTSTTLGSLSEKYDYPSLLFSLPEKPFLKNELRSHVKQYFVVSIRRTAIDTSEYSLQLPALSDLNEWYGREMLYEPYALRVIDTPIGKEIGVITDTDTETIQIKLLPNLLIIKKIFERASITADKSQAGLVADRLIALMEGVMGSSRIFQIPGVRKFIAGTSPIEQKTKSEITKAIKDDTSKGNTFDKFITQFGLGGKHPITPEQVFDVLTEKKLIKAGVETRCPKCSIKDWLTIDQIGDRYICEFCNQESKFIDCTVSNKTLSSSGERATDGLQWTYRLSGLLSKGDKQQGAIPVILTLLFLKKRLGSFLEDLHTTALDLSFLHNEKEVPCETDLVLVDLSKRLGKKSVEVLIGECKTNGSINEAKIERLLLARENLLKSGVNCYLIFSKTGYKFTQTEIKLFKKLIRKNINPILLTGYELETWHNEYDTYKKADASLKLPFEHPFTFEELAQNSIAIYKLNDK